MMIPSVRDNRRSRVKEIFCRSFINAAKLFPLKRLRRPASLECRPGLGNKPLVRSAESSFRREPFSSSFSSMTH